MADKVLRWTGQWVVECRGRGSRQKDRWMSRGEGKRARQGERWETRASWATSALCSLSRWPLSLSLGRRMRLPAAPSIMLTPTAEQHLFIRLDRWKRGAGRWDEEDESGSSVIHLPYNYKELIGTVLVPLLCSRSRVHVIRTPGRTDRYHERGSRECLIEAFASSVTLLSAPLCSAEGLSLHYIVLLPFFPPLNLWNVTGKWAQSIDMDENR